MRVDQFVLSSMFFNICFDQLIYCLNGDFLTSTLLRNAWKRTLSVPVAKTSAHRIWLSGREVCGESELYYVLALLTFRTTVFGIERDLSSFFLRWQVD